MPIPLLDLRGQMQALGTEIKQAVNEVLDSTRYIMGPKVEQLEAEIAQYVGVAHAIGMTSGTDALLAALMALDVGPGDVVVTTTYSFFATAGEITRLNATPALVDIDPETYNIDPDALRNWFEQNADLRGKVKAIMPVHLYGQCADMDPILEVASEFNVPVIEDAAQAIGSRYPARDGLRSAGSMGLAGCFSFFPTKNLGAVGDAGMVVTNDADFAEKLRLLRNHGAEQRYYHSIVGGNFRLDPIQAVVLSVKLPHLESWHTARRENAAYYDERLTIEGLVTPAIASKREHHIYNQYIIRVPERRDELRTFLADAKIASEVYYPVPFHQQKCFAYLGYKTGDFPVAEHAATHSLALPIYPELTRGMQDELIDRIDAFYA